MAYGTACKFTYTCTACTACVIRVHVYWGASSGLPTSTYTVVRTGLWSNDHSLHMPACGLRWAPSVCERWVSMQEAVKQKRRLLATLTTDVCMTSEQGRPEKHQTPRCSSMNSSGSKPPVLLAGTGAVGSASAGTHSLLLACSRTLKRFESTTANNGTPIWAFVTSLCHRRPLPSAFSS